MEAPLTPLDVLPNLLDAVGEAARRGETFHHLDRAVMGKLALFGYFSTDEANVQDPGSISRYHGNRLQDTMLGRLGDNFGEAMSHVPSFNQARQDGTLGLSMAAAQVGVRTVRYHGVHVADPKHKKDTASGKMLVVDGVVSSYNATYSLPDDEKLSTSLHEMFQGLYGGKSPVENISTPRGPSPGWEDPEDPWSHAWVPAKKTYLANGDLAEPDVHQPQPRTIEATKLTEYERILNEGLSVLIRRELEEIGVFLPKIKVPLVDWRKQVTMPKELEAWLDAIDATYDMMHRKGLVQADYVDDPDGTRLAPERRRNIIATDPSAIAKIKRDELNGLGHTLIRRSGNGSNNPDYQVHPEAATRKGDSRHNKEQHPNPRRRYPIERGVYLKRPKLKPGEAYYGPASSRPLNVFERALISVQETWYEVKDNPKGQIVKALPDVIGKVLGGVSDVLVSGSIILLKGGIAVGKGLANYGKDISGRNKQKALARTRLDTILTELLQKEAAIHGGAAPNVFPDTRMQPSPQLDVIKAMTATMRANLAYQAPDSIA